METKELYLLLNVVKENKNLNLLIREGMSYKLIGEITEFAAKEKLLEILQGQITLTELGESKLISWAKLFKRTNKKEWIEPALKSKVAKIDKNDIFLPSQDELSF
ncbi:MAG: hypothetical protein WKF85_07020 [Chitinophagaceae bacterium]